MQNEPPLAAKTGYTMSEQDSNPHANSVFQQRAIAKLERDLGAELVAALRDPKTTEIDLNPDGKVFVKRQGEPDTHLCNLNAAKAEAVVKTIAGFHGKEVTSAHPYLDGELPELMGGGRFAGQLPPIVKQATFVIRKPPSRIFTLNEYVQNNSLSDIHKSAICDAITGRKNILVIGSTESGKTTLVNAIIHEMVELSLPNERFIIIEDTGEIQCSASNFVQYHTTVDVSMTHLLKITLRMTPKRIVVGEVRGEEALDLLDAWNTGHPGGVATLHADSAAKGLTRLMSLVSRNKAAPDEIEPLIGEAVHLIVFIAKTPEGRRVVQEVLEVSGYVNGEFVTRNL